MSYSNLTRRILEFNSKLIESSSSNLSSRVQVSQYLIQVALQLNRASLFYASSGFRIESSSSTSSIFRVEFQTFKKKLDRVLALSFSSSQAQAWLCIDSTQLHR